MSKRVGGERVERGRKRERKVERKVERKRERKVERKRELETSFCLYFSVSRTLMSMQKQQLVV